MEHVSHFNLILFGLHLKLDAFFVGATFLLTDLELLLSDGKLPSALHPFSIFFGAYFEDHVGYLDHEERSNHSNDS